LVYTESWIWEPCIQGTLSACNRRRKTTDESRMGKKMQINAKIMITAISNPERLLIFLEK